MNRTTKKIAAMCLSVSIIAGGSMMLTPTSAHAYSTTTANRIVAFGDNYLGRPYQFGASTRTTRVFDCSSFTKYVYGHYGISLPRTSRQQARVGSFVPRSKLKKGDLVFFWTKSTGRGNVGHVAIYAGNGRILHTYGAGGVKFSNLNSSYWSSHYITARRVF